MTLLWSSIDDYQRGLESNLLAEFVGLIVGLAVTYFIVDRVVSARLKAHNEPLLRRLRERIEYGLGMMAYSWAVVLGSARAHEAVSASQGAFVDPIRQRLGAEPGPPVQLVSDIRAFDSEGPLLIATLTVENAQRITSLADRLSNVIATDVRLLEMLADLDSVVADLQVGIRHWSRIDEFAIQESETAIVELSKGAFDRALELRDYAERFR